jgi:pilus assembly protein Flp/PilA
MMTIITKFWRSEDGTMAIEYGILAASMAVVVVATVHRLGTILTDMFATVASAL